MYIYTYIHVHKHMFVFMYVRAPVCVCVCVYVYVFNARKHVLLVHPVHPPNKFFTMIQSNAHSKDFLREYTPLLRRKEPSTTMYQYNAESVSLIYKTPYKIDLFCGNIDIIYGGGRPLFRHKPCLHPIHAQQKYCQPNRALWRHFRHYLQRRKPIILSRTLSTSDPTLQKLTLAHVRHEQQGTHAPRLLVRSWNACCSVCYRVCCNVLQCLQCVAFVLVCCSMMQHINNRGTCSTTVRSVAAVAAAAPQRPRQLLMHCNTLQHTATRCNTRQHAATHCNMIV